MEENPFRMKTSMKSSDIFFISLLIYLYNKVRSEKALLEKQEQMLKLREEQLIVERKRQVRLR